MIMKFANRDNKNAFIWVDLSNVLAIGIDQNPWEIDLHLASDLGLMVKVIPFGCPETDDTPETPEEGVQRILGMWQEARAKVQNPLLSGRRL